MYISEIDGGVQILRRAGANLLFLIQKMGTDAGRMPISARNESESNLFSCA